MENLHIVDKRKKQVGTLFVIFFIWHLRFGTLLLSKRLPICTFFLFGGYKDHQCLQTQPVVDVIKLILEEI